MNFKDNIAGKRLKEYDLEVLQKYNSINIIISFDLIKKNTAEYNNQKD
jgi:hypothetical protein